MDARNPPRYERSIIITEVLIGFLSMPHPIIRPSMGQAVLIHTNGSKRGRERNALQPPPKLRRLQLYNHFPPSIGNITEMGPGRWVDDSI